MDQFKTYNGINVNDSFIVDSNGVSVAKSINQIVNTECFSGTNKVKLDLATQFCRDNGGILFVPKNFVVPTGYEFAPDIAVVYENGTIIQSDRAYFRFGTQVPSEAKAGDVYWDTTESVLNLYDGTTWTSFLRATKGNTVDGDMVVKGNLKVEGEVLTINTSELKVTDNIITLNQGVTGAPSLDSGIEVERGDATNAFLIWKESLQKWVAGTGDGGLTGISLDGHKHQATDVVEDAEHKFVSEAKAAAWDAKASVEYVDDQVNKFSNSGVPKLSIYQYPITATDGQIDFPVPLDTYDPATDTLWVFENSTFVNSTRFQIKPTNPGYKVTLNNAVSSGTNVVLAIFKNVLAGPEGSIAGNVIRVDTMPQDRVVGLDQRLTTIETQGSTNAAGITTNAGQITALSQNISSASARLDAIESQKSAEQVTPITLPVGSNIVQVDNDSKFSLPSLKGQAVGNLLGTAGDCEDITKWTNIGGTLSVDNTSTTYVVYGGASIKGVPDTYGHVWMNIDIKGLIQPNKFYVAVAEVRNTVVSANSNISLACEDAQLDSYDVDGNLVPYGSSFKPTWIKFSGSAVDAFNPVKVKIGMYTTGGTTGQVNYDGIRLYEITEADYNSLDANITPDQVSAMYPYYSGLVPVRNPYAIRYGENLLPNLLEGWLNVNRNDAIGIGNVNGPYDFSLTATTSNTVTIQSPNVPVVPKKSYTFAAQHNGEISVRFLNKNLSAAGSSPNTAAQSITYTAPVSAAYAYVVFQNTASTAGQYSFKNPVLNEGSIAKTFKPRKDSMLAFQTDLFAHPVTGANADTLFEKDGQYFKSKRWQSMVIDGSLPWAWDLNGVGYKTLKFSSDILPSGVGDIWGTKFDGKALKKWKASISESDYIWFQGSGRNIYLTVSVADSGWGDSYTPSADEIKAYFYGWKMYDANTITPANAQTATTATWTGTGTKYWVQVAGSPVSTSAVPTNPYSGYTPYQIAYQLLSPVLEPVVSEGELTLIPGDNQVEVGTGIILREPTTVSLNATRYYINAGYPLAYKPYNILAVYKNGALDQRWELQFRPTNDPTYVIGRAFVRVSDQLFTNSSDSYSVTYLMSDRTPSVDFAGSYGSSEKTIMTSLINSVQQATTRLSVVENRKSDKDSAGVYTPTLLNSWTFFPAYENGYRKILGTNLVLVQITLMGGNAASGTILFKLPAGFRPRNYACGVAIVRNSSNALSATTVEAKSNGDVFIGVSPGATYNSALSATLLFEAIQ